MTDPEWDSFIRSMLEIDSKSRSRFLPNQQKYFANTRYFGGLEASNFRTLAGGILQEIIARCGNDKKIVASRAGMSVTNLYSILNGNRDPKLGTLLKIAYSSGFALKIGVIKTPTR